jgi:hypothetical protein
MGGDFCLKIGVTSDIQSVSHRVGWEAKWSRTLFKISGNLLLGKPLPDAFARN